MPSSSRTARRASRSAKGPALDGRPGRISCSMGPSSPQTPSAPTGSCCTSARTTARPSRRSAERSPSGGQPAHRLAGSTSSLAPGGVRRGRGVRGRPLRQRRATPDPTTMPPRPYEHGIGRRPTLVQNVESLAHAALIARRGDAWYREAGRGATRGTALVTVGGAGRERGPRDRARDADRRAGGQSVGAPRDAQARAARRLLRRLDPRRARRGTCRSTRSRSGAPGSAFGCGVVGVPAVHRLRRRDDRPDPRLHGRPERRPVRSVRLRPAGHRRRDRSGSRRAVPAGDDLERIERLVAASSPVAARAVIPTARSASS